MFLPMVRAMFRASARIAVAALFLLVAPAPADAQFGLRGGVSLTDFFGDDIQETDRRRGLNLGAYVDVFGVGPLEVAAEVYYRQKGADLAALQAGSDPGGTPGSVEFGVDYVEIPLLLRWNVVQGSRARFYLAGGPAFAWRIDCGVTVSTGSGATTPNCDDLLQSDLGDTLRDHERGVVLSGGIDVRVLQGLGALNLDARYTRGLSRVTEDLDWKNEALSVMLGWEFAPNWR